MFWTMRRTAASLGRRAGLGKPLPALLFFTDPVRVPDPEAAVVGLPPEAAVVFRAFGAPDAEARGRRLRAALNARGAKLLVGADARLAASVGADGVHLPQRLACQARRIRSARPSWIVTAAAHDLRSARRAAIYGAHAIVLSPIFPSRSPSAGRPIGVLRLAQLVQRIGAPVYALGGVNDDTARLLLRVRLGGLAGVEGLYGSRT